MTKRFRTSAHARYKTVTAAMAAIMGAGRNTKPTTPPSGVSARINATARAPSDVAISAGCGRLFQHGRMVLITKMTKSVW